MCAKVLKIFGGIYTPSKIIPSLREQTGGKDATCAPGGTLYMYAHARKLRSSTILDDRIHLRSDNRVESWTASYTVDFIVHV